MLEIISAVNAAGNTAVIFKSIYRAHAQQLEAIHDSFRQAESMISQPEWHSEEGFKTFLVTFGLAVAASAKLAEETNISLGAFGVMALSAVCDECEKRKVKVCFTEAGALFE
ncbi:MAG: hypothetical protein Q8T09_02930 [Candidatus Melainabacteria bacterium]|nr:hypothetical protein [Candidatus Melainabacteria bacterium]